MGLLAQLFETEFDITNQQKLFVEGMFAGLTKKQAMARAGYSESTNIARIIQENPDMQAYADKLQAEERKKWRITREQVTQGLMEAIQDAKTLEEPNTQINGWRELGRLHGLYEPEEKKVTLSAEKSEQVRQIEEASVDELLDLAGADIIEGDFELVSP